jgi:hypothetical protein
LRKVSAYLGKRKQVWFIRTILMSLRKRPEATQDPYRHEGAVEQDAPQQPGNSSLQGQLGHRNKPEELDSLDTDFPEPGENPEHSGEKQSS